MEHSADSVTSELSRLPWIDQMRRAIRARNDNLRIGFEGEYLRKIVQSAGGRWNARDRVWELPYSDILNLWLQSRIVKNVKMS